MLSNMPYMIVLHTSSLIYAVLIIYALRYRVASGSASFAALMLCALIWSGGYSLEIASSSFEMKVLWRNIQQISIFSFPIIWLMFALSFCGKKRWLTSKIFVPLSLPLLLFIILIWTNDYHQLIHSDIYIVETSALSVLETELTVLAYVFIVYAYLVLAISLYIFMQAYKLAMKPYRVQLFLISLSLALPFITNILSVLGFNPLDPFRLTSTVIVFSGLLLVWALFRHQFYRIRPIPRGKIMDSVQFGIIISDAWRRIVDLNPSAASIVQSVSSRPDAKLIGQRLSVLLQNYPMWSKMYAEQKEDQLEIILDEDQCYHVHVTLLKSRKNAFIGHLTEIHNITKRKRIEKELHKRATTDFLTNINNRRHFMELSNHEFHNAVRYKKSISLIMLDLDFFKEINDTYGHKAGDEVLKQFAQILRDILRKTDIFGRLGGEEFAVTLTETTLEQACIVGEKLRKTIENSHFTVGDDQIQCTISLGIASRLETDRSIECLILRADDLLYNAKEKRNSLSTQ